MLKIRDVFKSYKDNNVLKGVTLDVKNNEIKGLIGVNGAGKSTLIELICNVKSIDSGSIVLNGLTVGDKKNKESIKFTIGYMPQMFNLFNDLTVEENLGYLCAVYHLNKDVEIDRIIKLCNLEKMRKKLAMNLSGGCRQLLALAAALIHKPKLLILDEPTSAMDPLFRKGFWNIVRESRKEGCTILVITHYMEELLECDSFACLSNGKIVVDESIDKFKSLGELDIERILENYTKE